MNYNIVFITLFASRHARRLNLASDSPEEGTTRATKIANGEQFSTKVPHRAIASLQPRMPGMDDFAKCAAFSPLCGFKLRLADGVRFDAVRWMLRAYEESYMLRLYEVRHSKLHVSAVSHEKLFSEGKINKLLTTTVATATPRARGMQPG